MANTYGGFNYYNISLNTGTGYFTIGSYNNVFGALGIADDEFDTTFSDGSTGDGIEYENELFSLFYYDIKDSTGTYSGWKIEEYPIINTGYGTLFQSNSPGLEGISGTATNAPFYYALCFLKGTRIAVENGWRSIEDLRIGDPVLTAAGTARPVKWIGRMQRALNRFNRATLAPVCIRAGALSPGVPSRDLYVSPDHAILVDDVLTNAGVLVNGFDILQCTEFEGDTIEYLQIELETHDLVLAEGTAAETFLEDGDNRRHFDNAAEYASLYPANRPAAPMPYGRVTSCRQLPARIRRQLATRRLGHG